MRGTDAEVAVAAAGAGARVVRSSYGGRLTRVDKGPNDFATSADLEAEAAILAVLRASRPEDAVLGEESGRSGPVGERTWLVDPLCGTLNYAATTPLVAVNVALRAGDAVRVAAVADPLAGELFWTDGEVARLRRDGDERPMAASPDSRLVDVNVDTAHPGPRGFRPAQLIGDAPFRERFGPRVLSTTLALAWVAAGRRAGYVTDGDMRDSVHFAAGIALCQAAGCVVTDLYGGPVGRDATGLVAAADADTHAALLACIAVAVDP
jgi:myo-inositol-1(or 4)-monophosphatase